MPRARWATIHMVRYGERIWMFNDQGELIITELSPEGLRQVSRAKLIEPSAGQYSGTFSQVKRANDSDPREGTSMFSKSTGVVWSHPAFAKKHVFIRNDTQLVCAYLGKE